MGEREKYVVSDTRLGLVQQTLRAHTSRWVERRYDSGFDSTVSRMHYAVYFGHARCNRRSTEQGMDAYRPLRCVNGNVNPHLPVEEGASLVQPRV